MKLLKALALTILLTAGVASAGTVALYDFNGGGTAAVGSTIFDSVGGHNGAVVGGALLYGFDPIVGSYLSFDADGPSVGGLGNRVEIPGSPAFLFSTNEAYTFEAVFRTTQTVTNGVILSKGCDVSNPDSQWWLRHQGNGLLRGLVEGVDNTVEDMATSATGFLYNDGVWHHVAVVYDGTQATKRLDIYLDYVLRGSDTAIGTLGLIGGTDADPVIFGEYASLAANRSFAGDLAAVRFSNAALTAAEFMLVPEPSSLALLACAGAMSLWARRRGGN